MDQFLDFIEKRRWGIMATFMLHVILLLYLQIDTYEYKLPEREYDVFSEIIEEEFIELDPEQIIVPEEIKKQNSSGEVRNLTQNVFDQREKSKDNFSKSSTDQKVQQSVKDLERQFFEEFSNAKGGSNASGEGSSKSGSSSPSQTSSKQSDSSKPTKDNSNASSSGSENQIDGNVMKRYELKDRFPHNHNDYHIRNPGYTCEKGANGLVVIAIRVNQNGDVIAARFVPEMSDKATKCMIEQAEIYAKKSRFTYKSDAPKSQEGFIYYTFVSKK